MHASYHCLFSQRTHGRPPSPPTPMTIRAATFASSLPCACVVSTM
uniref:Uncharacterized protein n=1 Tax=Arundo donax TaxID=35708 RepID=A0A0A8XQC3_ARUDO